MNFRRGLDVPEGGESSGVSRLGFAWLDFESPSRIEGVERRGAAPMVEYKRRNPRVWSGVYIPQHGLSVVPTWARYYRGYEKIETVSSYR
jgi:hypothetical protein